MGFKNFFYIDGKTDQEVNQNISIKKNIIKSYKLNINDTFSIEGSLISTLPPNMSSIYSNNNTTQSINGSNNKINNEKAIEQDLTNNNSKYVSTLSSDSPQKLLSTAKPFSSNMTNTQSNESNSISDNLVSLLSGIIIESIHNGNPTINNKSTSLDLNAKNNKNIILVSGKWKLDVQNGNVTDFATKFAMITSNGTGFHWHSMNNFQSKEKLFFGNDNSATLNGQLDFFTGNNNTTKKTVDTLLSINNLELIQLTLLDKEIAGHFQGYPLYGTIDSIKIKN